MRFSKQREAVYEVLRKTKSHPDVAWIYANARKIIPDISIATVYRNLEELREIGLIKKVSVEGYAERYDANVEDHAHIVCDVCGKIADADMTEVTVNHNFDGVSRCEVTFYGVCEQCRSKKSIS